MGSYPGYRGNADKVMVDAERIVNRLRKIGTTLGQIKAERRCSYATLYAAIFSRISKEEYRQIAISKLKRAGTQTRWKKGHATWNKNRKGMHLSPATEFKKGNRPANYRPIGEVYVIRDKGGKSYRWIKLTDRGPMPGRRMPYARYLWQKKNGPIPPGLLVIHRDGNTLNDQDDNLLLATRAENVAHQWATIPGHLQKFRHEAGKASKRRHKHNRIIKERLRKERERRASKEQKENEKRRIFAVAICEIKGPVETWWQCNGCGEDFHTDKPPAPCPKCGHLVFERIEQPVAFLRRQVEVSVET